uniref:4Fe-4S dicluster domain-containing protein n=1 Tax=Muribaculaceae bacterium Z82 TaxID=2304548 RepID=A0A7C9JS07_9BACT
MKRAMVMDLDRCTGCQSCIVACKFENNSGLGNYRCDIVDVGPYGTHPDIQMYWLPFQCQQCENAPCIEVCPTGASYRDPDNGVVLIGDQECIGCMTCLAACPFSDNAGAARPSARWFNEERNVVEKCTLCNHLTAKSDGVENPADSLDAAHAVPPCVYNCPTKCRHFGDLDDAASEASQMLAQAKAEGRPTYTLASDEAQATFVYILSESTAPWNGMGEWRSLVAKG